MYSGIHIFTFKIISENRGHKFEKKKQAKKSTWESLEEEREEINDVIVLYSQKLKEII